MEERFKFRVYDNKKKEWLLGYTPSLGGFSLCGETMLFGEWQGVLETYLREDRFDDLRIMQCTGMTDKTGNLIYDSDIIDWDNVAWGTSVVWSEEFTGWALMNAEFPDDGVVPLGVHGAKSAELEITGNIYDELLNE